MNKEKLEEMILEELVNEARNDRTVNNMPDNYKETARGTFGDMVDDQETLITIWLHYGPSVVNYASNQGHKLKLRTLGGDESKVDEEDFQKLHQVAQSKPEIQSLDQLLNLAASVASSDAEPTATPAGERPAETEPTAEPTSEPTSEPTAEPSGEASSEPAAEPSGETATEPSGEDSGGEEGGEEVNPNRFVPTEDVKKAVEAMKGFYDKPYLYEQGNLLRTLIKAIEAALKGEDREAGITSRTSTLPLQEAKGLNIKNIKASLNAFLQQTRKVKKALQEYIAMAGEAKAGAKRKKAILDKEVDQLIEYGKMILKSLPKTISEAEEAETNPETTTEESNVDLQPLHDFITFILGNELGSSNKDDVQGKLEKVKKILKVFPNVAPFGSADGTELDEYENKFKEAIDTHLKTAIANFKSLESAKGGEAAIKGLRTELIQFLGNGLSILGKDVKGEDIEQLGSDEAIDPKDETAEVSDLSPEAIMAELGLDTSGEGKITTTSDEEEVLNPLDQILIKLSQNKRYDTPREISDFIYDQIKYEKGFFGNSKEALKAILRAIGARKSDWLREEREDNFDVEEFAQKFFSEIVKMSIEYRSTKDKKALRQASDKMSNDVFAALKKYKKIRTSDPDDPAKIITYTDKTVTDMFQDISDNISTKGPADIKYNKVLHYIEKNIDKMNSKLFIKTVKKMDANKISQKSAIRLQELSKEMFQKDPLYLNNVKLTEIITELKGENNEFITITDTSISIELDKVNLDFLSNRPVDINAVWSLEDIDPEDSDQLKELADKIYSSRNLLWDTKFKIKDTFATGKDPNEPDYIEFKKNDTVQIKEISKGRDGESLNIKIKNTNKESEFFGKSETFNFPVYDLIDGYLDIAIDTTPSTEEGSSSSETATEQIQRKLEKLVENYINKRKQQWRKRTM